jgi:putative flippase GtrA
MKHLPAPLSKFVYFCAKLFKKRPRFIKFMLVGILNTIFGYTCFALFVFLGFGDILAPFFANFLGILFNFKTYGHFVFKNSDNSLIFKFFAVYGIVYISNVIGLILFAKAGLENRYISGFILLLPLALLAYYLNGKYVFKKKGN